MGLNIKKVIKEHGLTVKDVAKRMEITNVGLSYHINGNPSVEVLERVAHAIGCDVRDLFDDASLPADSMVCPSCGARFVLQR